MTRIMLNDKALRHWEKIKAEFENRKIPKETWITILSDGLLSVPHSFWRAQVERHTPSAYLLERALKDPKLSKQLAEFLKSKLSEPAAEHGEAH